MNLLDASVDGPSQGKQHGITYEHDSKHATMQELRDSRETAQGEKAFHDAIQHGRQIALHTAPLVCPRPQPAMEERLHLLDVVQIPTIGVLVFQHLGYSGRKQARSTCRDLCILVKHARTKTCTQSCLILTKVLCTQVDTNISSLTLRLPDTPEEEQHIGLRLKQRKLQPKSITLQGSESKNSRRGDALAAAGLDMFMQRVTQATIIDDTFPVGMAKVDNPNEAVVEPPTWQRPQTPWSLVTPS
jgi:hypothetical protein